MVEYDQLDLSNAVVAERIARWMQYIEEGERQKIEEKRMSQALQKGGSASLREHFSGRPRMAGGAIVSPALLKFAAERCQQIMSS